MRRSRQSAVRHLRRSWMIIFLIAFENHEISHVFYGVDVFSFYNPPDMQTISEDVEFLVNGNPFDDVEYLWNMDIIGRKIPDMIVTSQDQSYEEGLTYQLNKDVPVRPEAVLKMHCPGAEAYRSRSRSIGRKPM